MQLCRLLVTPGALRLLFAHRTVTSFLRKLFAFPILSIGESLECYMYNFALVTMVGLR